MRSFADLTSRKGWARVDYDQSVWIPCLAALPQGYDTAGWAREFSAAWWQLSGLDHGPAQLGRLAGQLTVIRDGTYGKVPCHMAFIHLPDPRLDPLPVYLAVLAASGELDARLRTLTMADDPGVVRPPIVDEFSTGPLGTGLRVLRHFPDSPAARPPGAPGGPAAGDDAMPAICGGLSYAWRSAAFGTDLRLFTASPDLGRLTRAIPDIDELASRITVVPAAGG